jgi:WD40 repeat protein
LQFAKSNEYLAAGLGDGIVKVWDLLKKEVKRTFKPSNYYPKQSVS